MAALARRLARPWVPLATALALALAAASARAVELIGTSFSDGLVYRVDAATGLASDPRPLSIGSNCVPPTPCSNNPVNLTLLAGVDVGPDGALLFATVEATPSSDPNLPYPSHLFSAHDDGAALVIDSFGDMVAQVGEGDLAVDPLTGDLYAVGLTDLIAPFTLLRVDLPSSTAAVVGNIGLDDISGLAFDATGKLYALDTDADALLTLDPSNASTLSTTPLSTTLGALAGMDFDPVHGTLYVADGGTGGKDALFTLDPQTGVVTEIGPLGLANGLSGLAVPEPGAAALAAAAFAALVGVAARRR